MKTKILIAIGFILVSFSFLYPYFNSDCEEVKLSADDAYANFKKCSYSTNLEEGQRYAKKGMNAASDAEDEASESECNCEDAESAASNAYSNGKRAYNSDNISDLQYYARKAMRNANDITDAADDCED